MSILFEEIGNDIPGPFTILILFCRSKMLHSLHESSQHSAFAVKKTNSALKNFVQFYRYFNISLHYY